MSNPKFRLVPRLHAKACGGSRARARNSAPRVLHGVVGHGHLAPALLEDLLEPLAVRRRGALEGGGKFEAVEDTEERPRQTRGRIR